jgi:hypothetical protein
MITSASTTNWEMVQDHLLALREAVAELLESGTQDSSEAT